MRLTINKVNQEIAKRGGKAKLVYNRQGGPYFYFINVGPAQVPSQSIPVSHLTAYTLEEWISEWEHAEAEEAKL